MKKRYVRQRTTTRDEDSYVRQMVRLFKKTPIPDDEILFNLGLYLPSRILARILLMDHLFRLALPLHGEVLEFGTRWGQNFSLFASLRGIYEPFNRHRKVVAFDTFEGLSGVRGEDGRSSFMRDGSLAVSTGYEQHLEKLMDLKEKLDPLSHFKKYEIRKGPAEVSLAKYFEEHPESIVSLAFFDMDVYQPTRDCLAIIRDHLTKGSVVAFDELNEPEAPGETIALEEVFGLSRYSIRRYQYAARVAYLVVD